MNKAKKIQAIFLGFIRIGLEKVSALVNSWLRGGRPGLSWRRGVAQGQASAISAFAPSSAESSTGGNPCRPSGAVEAMVAPP